MKNGDRFLLQQSHQSDISRFLQKRKAHVLSEAEDVRSVNWLHKAYI